MLNNPFYYKRILETFPRKAPTPYENQIDMARYNNNIGLKKNLSWGLFFPKP
jgi:hypothetical protein